MHKNRNRFEFVFRQEPDCSGFPSPQSSATQNLFSQATVILRVQVVQAMLHDSGNTHNHKASRGWTNTTEKFSGWASCGRIISNLDCWSLRSDFHLVLNSKCQMSQTNSRKHRCSNLGRAKAQCFPSHSLSWRAAKQNNAHTRNKCELKHSLNSTWLGVALSGQQSPHCNEF